MCCRSAAFVLYLFNDDLLTAEVTRLEIVLTVFWDVTPCSLVYRQILPQLRRDEYVFSRYC
jgi:hypothetical protein